MKKITPEELAFSKEVSKRLHSYIITGYRFSPKLLRKFYKLNYGIEETCRLMVLNAKP